MLLYNLVAEHALKSAPLATTMSLRVYYSDSNPAIDTFAFRQSNARAQELVSSKQACYITLGDGRTAVQLYRPQQARQAQREQKQIKGGSSGGMGFIKFVLPESSKQIQRNSLVRNVRTFAALA